MKVKATRLGFVGHRRRYPGQVFHIEQELFSSAWMEEVGAKPKVELPPNEEAAPVAAKVHDSMTMDQLYSYCKDNGLKGYSGFSKKELVDAINGDELQVESEKLDDDVI